jgi:hypothetical protein
VGHTHAQRERERGERENSLTQRQR